MADAKARGLSHYGPPALVRERILRDVLLHAWVLPGSQEERLAALGVESAAGVSPSTLMDALVRQQYHCQRVVVQ